MDIRAKLVNPYPSVITLSFKDTTKDKGQTVDISAKPVNTYLPSSRSASRH